jgi:putative endonuclease
LGKNKEIGNKGESIAIEYLLKAGYRILHTNFRRGKFEIDIIGTKDEILVFFEVKTRKNLTFGPPEDAIDDKKMNNILDCANDYILETQWLKRIRFDIISITLFPRININHIQDAFF